MGRLSYLGRSSCSAVAGDDSDDENDAWVCIEIECCIPFRRVSLAF